MNTRVAIYARTSTTNDQSCERQIFELREIAKNHNWTIVDEFIDEGVSGAKKSRPELDSLV